MNSTGSSEIISVGYYLPETAINTEQLLAEIGPDRYEVDVNYIAQNVGVECVRHSAADQRPSDLAIAAAESALAKTAIDPSKIGLIIFTGIEGDYAEPSTAHIIQSRLRLQSAMCFDVQNACLGFMSGLQIADALIATGTIRYALVCTGEQPSRVTYATIKELRNSTELTLFQNRVGMLTVGDAGGAVIVGPRAGGGFLNFGTTSHGQYAKLCYYRPANNGLIEGQMVMGRICAVTIQAHKQVYRETLNALDWSPSNIDCLITHQVGRRPFEALSHAFGVEPARMTRTYHCYGNVTSATFPVNLGRAYDEQRLKPGSRVWAAMSGSGISVCHAGMVIQ